MNSTTSEATEVTTADTTDIAAVKTEAKKSIDDDMRLRSLRDSNRRPVLKPTQVLGVSINPCIGKNAVKLPKNPYGGNIYKL